MVIGCFCVLFFAFRAYDRQHSERNYVIATVNHWQQAQSKGNYLWYVIDVILPDGSNTIADTDPSVLPIRKTTNVLNW